MPAYFDRHQTEYYNLLLKVSQQSDWVNWIAFFLHAVIHQAREASENIQKINLLRNEYDEKLNIRRPIHVVSMIVDQLFINPMITISGITKQFKIHYHTAEKAVKILQEMDILKGANNDRKRGKVFVAHEIMEILS
jgi:Fic family protein